MDACEGNACRKIRENHSCFVNEESINEWRFQNDVTASGDEGEVEIEHCEENENVCDNIEEDDLFYMYETVFRELHIRLPFTQFECDVLEKLNCAPVQLGPNAWAFLKAYQIICGVTGMEPSLGVFFSFHEAKVREVGSWVYIGSQNKKGFLRPYASNYKSYKHKFFRVKAEYEAYSLITDEEGNRLFPISWQKEPFLISNFKAEALTEKEVADKNYLDKLRPESCKSYIEKEHDPKALKDIISEMSSMTDAHVRAILREKKNPKPKQEPGVDEKKGVDTSKSPLAGIVGRKRSGDELKQTTLNFNRKSVGRQDGKKKKEIATASEDDDVVDVTDIKGKSRWYVHMKSMEFEINELEAINDRREVEIEEIRNKNKELELKVKKMTNQEGEMTKLKKLNKDLQDKLAKANQEKDEAMSNEDIQKGIASSLQTEVDQKNNQIHELQVEVAERYDSGFEFALQQVKIVHPGLDLSEVNILKIISDGKLVEAMEVETQEDGDPAKKVVSAEAEGTANVDEEGSPLEEMDGAEK